MNDINLRTITRLRAIPLAHHGREIGTRYEMETADGTITPLDHPRHFALWRSLLAAGARLRHLNLGLEMRCRGVEVAVIWPEPPAGHDEPPANEDEPPAPSRPASADEAIEQMAAKGKAARPALTGRLDSAAQLVHDGRVTLTDDATAQIGPYRISADACTCRDFTFRGGWCKHRLAVRMARHLTANGFRLPQAAEPEACPQVSAKDRALIASGRVIDDEQRSRHAFHNSSEGARQRLISAAAHGAKSFPAGDWAKANGTTSYEPRTTNEK